jgi:deazaflavin-dependent oxidoreductase (nitroreductase family)
MSHLENAIMSTLVRARMVPRACLLTTRGRRTGLRRTNPVVPVEQDGRLWLVAPYGAVPWVLNARAAGRVTLRRRHGSGDYTIRDVPPGEAGPVLKDYFRIAPAARRSFQATGDSSAEDFAAEAERHPVFELTPVR